MQTKANLLIHSALDGIVDMSKRVHGDDWVKSFTNGSPLEKLLFHVIHLASATSSTLRLSDQSNTTMIRFFDLSCGRMAYSTMQIAGHTIPDDLGDDDLAPIGIHIDRVNNIAWCNTEMPERFETTFDNKTADQLFDELNNWPGWRC